MKKTRLKSPIPVVLVSASERRKTMLKELGIRHKSRISSVRENCLPNESPREASTRLALEKARNAGSSDGLVIGMDTIVVVGKRILGKPDHPREAVTMLRFLSGKMHRVISGVALLYRGQQVIASDETKVYFRKLTESEIRWYVKTGEPLDKAGAYAIQGQGRIFVTRIEGCYYNVVGFPLNSFQQSLQKIGLTIYDLMNSNSR